MEADGAEPLPVPFRYDVLPIVSKRTVVFRPNALQGEIKTANLGAVWTGNYEKIPSTKMVDVIWEAS